MIWFGIILIGKTKKSFVFPIRRTLLHDTWRHGTNQIFDMRQTNKAAKRENTNDDRCQHAHLPTVDTEAETVHPSAPLTRWPIQPRS